MLSHRRRDKFSKIAWYERANSSVLSRLLNCNTDVEERTERGRAFHVDAAADWKDRSPRVEWIVRGTIRSEDEAERSRWRVCIPEMHCNKDVRYSGAEPWRHRYVSTASRNLIPECVNTHLPSVGGWKAELTEKTSCLPAVLRILPSYQY